MIRYKPVIIVGAAVALLTVVVFYPTLRYGFVNWDDDLYVYENPHLTPLTPRGVWHLLTTPYYRSFTPVTFLSHAFDVAIWRMSPFGHHLMNVLLHSMNAGLVFWLALLVMIAASRGGNSTLRLTLHDVSSSIISGAVIAALLFSLHPLRAESVSWISGRKDLLAVGFMLLATIFYFYKYDDVKFPGKNNILLAALYLLALGSKTSAAALPLVWMSCDVLLFRRSLRASFISAVPFLLLAAAAGMIAKVAAPDLDPEFVFGERSVWELAALPFTAIFFYLQNHLLPYNLSPVYHTQRFLPDDAINIIIAVVVVTGLALFSLLALRKQQPAPLLAYASFVLFILPTFAGMLSGIQPVADRYTYMASVSLCMLAGAGVERVLRGTERSLLMRNIVMLGVLGVFASFTYVTIHQMRVWRDPMTLWSYVVPRAPFPLAYKNLGKAQLAKEMYRDAAESFKKALQLRPEYAEALHYRGVAFMRMGESDSAMHSLRKALSLQPRLVEAHLEIGKELLRRGMPDSALMSFAAALRADSAFVPAHYAIADVMMERNQHVEAAAAYTKALMLNPLSPEGWFNLGVAYEAQEIFTNAAECYKKALSLREDYLEALINLGNVYARTGEPTRAIELFGRALALYPHSADAYYNMGYVLFSIGEVARAEQAFASAIRADSTYATAYFNLAILTERRGDGGGAMELYKSAARLGYAEAQAVLHSRGVSW